MPKLRPYLRRFEYLALKDKVSGSDPAQVPAAANIDFYSPGAFVRTAPGAPISPNDPDPTVVEVWDTGSILSSEQLAHGASTQARFVVNSMPDGTHLELSALQDTTLSVGDRLVRLANRPKVYSDPYGTVEIVGSRITCSASTGRAFGYLTADRFDHVVTGGGVTARVVPDTEGGLLRTPPNWFNVLDYPTIQAAIDAVPASGGTVYIPGSSVPYNTLTKPSYTPPIRLPGDRGIRLVGDGPYATILESTNPAADMILMAGDYQTIEQLTLAGPGSTGSGRGIRIWRDATSTLPQPMAYTAVNIIYRAAIRDVQILNTASWGIYIDTAIRSGLTLTNHAVWGMIERVEIRGNRSGGCIFIAPPPAVVPISGDTTTYYFHMCHLRDFVGYGFRAQLSRGITLLDCIFEGNDTDQPYVSLESCSDVRIQSAWFENGVATQTVGTPPQYVTAKRYFIELSRVIDPRYPSFYQNILIDNCMFFRGGVSLPVNPKAISVGAYGRGVLIAGGKIEGGPTIKNADPADPQSIAILIEDGAWATVVGGSMMSGVLNHSPFQVVDAATQSKGVMLGTGNLLRLPRVLTQDYVLQINPYVKEGDVVYDVSLHALRVCTGFTTDTPPLPIWRPVVLGA